jgi:hypothetical protein
MKVKVIVSWIWCKNWPSSHGLSPGAPSRFAVWWTTALDKPMWYDVSELPYVAIVRSLLLSEKLRNFFSPKTEISVETLDFLTSRRDEIAAIWMGYRIEISWRNMYETAVRTEWTGGMWHWRTSVACFYSHWRCWRKSHNERRLDSYSQRSIVRVMK